MGSCITCRHWNWFADELPGKEGAPCHAHLADDGVSYYPDMIAGDHCGAMWEAGPDPEEEQWWWSKVHGQGRVAEVSD